MSTILSNYVLACVKVKKNAGQCPKPLLQLNWRFCTTPHSQTSRRALLSEKFRIGEHQHNFCHRVLDIYIYQAKNRKGCLRGPGGLHQNSLEIDLIVVSGRRE